jgi:hypothetical protein
MEVDNGLGPGKSPISTLKWKYLFAALLLLVLFQFPAIAQESLKPPVALEVLPVFFVPRGETQPSAKEQKVVLDHLKWTNDIYRKFLQGRTGFRISRRAPLIIDGEKRLKSYRQLPEMAAPEILGEILNHIEHDRFSTPYIFLVVVTNREDEFPVGGGRPINGGLNEGGGLVVLSQYAFNSVPHIQSTLQHEIGHGLGLMHVNAYRYDITNNESIMSYDPRHHTREFTDSPTPGTLIPEDLRALAINDRGIENLTFSAAKDVPVKYSLCPYVPSLPAMRIAGHPDYSVRLSSDSPDEFGSAIGNIVQKQIFSNRGPGVTYNPNFMWHSSPDSTGWVTVNVKFPRPITLDQVVLHSEHSGQYHRVTEMKVAFAGKGGLQELGVKGVDAEEFHLKFDRTESQAWVISFRPGASGFVCIRGLQFFEGEQEWFRPCVIIP